MNEIQEKKVTYKQMGFKSLLAWLKTGSLGILFSLICLIIAFVLLSKSEMPNPGFAKLNVFADKIWLSILFFSSFIYPVLYVIFANQYALKTLLYQLWRNKLVDFIVPKVDSYTLKLANLQPNWFKNLTTSAAVKAQLLSELRKDQSINKVQRIILNYGFRKLKLKNVDFQQPEDVFSSLLVERVRALLMHVSAPSPFIFLILGGIQFLILMLAIFLN